MALSCNEAGKEFMRCNALKITALRAVDWNAETNLRAEQVAKYVRWALGARVANGERMRALADATDRQ
jgi:hypothetical protein